MVIDQGHTSREVVYDYPVVLGCPVLLLIRQQEQGILSQRLAVFLPKVVARKYLDESEQVSHSQCRSFLNQSFLCHAQQALWMSGLSSTRTTAYITCQVRSLLQQG